MRFASIILFALALASCSGLGNPNDTASASCHRKVAAAETAVTQSYQSTLKLFKAGTIDKDTARKAVTATDAANSAVDNANRLCGIDEPKAADYLYAAGSFLQQAVQFRGE